MFVNDIEKLVGNLKSVERIMEAVKHELKPLSSWMLHAFF